MLFKQHVLRLRYKSRRTEERIDGSAIRAAAIRLDLANRVALARGRAGSALKR
jgi:hypothetical protein